MVQRDIAPESVAQAVAKWWFYYDEWNPAVLRSLVTDDFAFSCRSDTGATAYEDFITCDLRGVDEVMAWQEEHRINSPYPLRHNGANIFITGVGDSAITFSSYIFVTKIIEGRPYSLSSGIVHGSARVTSDGIALQRLEVVLDTRESVRYSDLPAGATSASASRVH
ncbi:hypothetical protein C8K36_11431 [Rhodococcus sp. OK519]|uniref:hypothetical protein n=1 Tax=Rhodococcus sp. OK519 TaxID=2135729 RepID=UPI000D37BF24|nr:hypothetical protein C8K36_11431 [Rhodococcus sp. OK519]